MDKWVGPRTFYPIHKILIKKADWIIYIFLFLEIQNVCKWQTENKMSVCENLKKSLLEENVGRQNYDLLNNTY